VHRVGHLPRIVVELSTKIILDGITYMHDYYSTTFTASDRTER